jgi:hypothetical protein
MLQIIEQNFLPQHTKNNLDKNEDNIYFLKYPIIESIRDKCVSDKKFDYLNKVILSDRKKLSGVGMTIGIKPLFPEYYTDKNHYKNISSKSNPRKHRGIIQTGGNTGRLRKGYKYTGRRLKNGKAEIVRVKRN